MIVTLIGPPDWRRRADVDLEVAVLMLLTMLDALEVSFVRISVVTTTEPDVTPVIETAAASTLMSVMRAVMKAALLNVSTVPGTVKTA